MTYIYIYRVNKE